MEDKNELSDIILEKESSSVLKTKRILIIVATLILIFLIVLVSMKLINKPSNNNDRKNIHLPPEPTNTVTKDVKDDQLFKQVPIIEEKSTDKKEKESFEDMVKSLKEKEVKKEKTLRESSKNNIEKEITKNVKETKEKIKQEIKNVVAPVKKEEKTKAVTKEKTTKMETRKASPVAQAKKGIYIQVGATSRLKPDKKFLAKIKKSGYNYALLPIVVNGQKVTKILVGPFKSRTDIKSNLPKVKKEINKDAFIYRVK